MSPPLRLAPDEIASVVCCIDSAETLLRTRLVARVFYETPEQLESRLLRNWRARGKKLRWWIVARDGSKFLLKWMLHHRPSGSSGNNKAIFSVTRAGRLDILQWLCGLPGTVGIDVSPLLVTAASRGHDQICSWLLTLRAYDNYWLLSAIRAAVVAGQTMTAFILVGHRAENATYARNIAACHGRAAVLERLFDSSIVIYEFEALCEVAAKAGTQSIGVLAFLRRTRPEQFGICMQSSLLPMAKNLHPSVVLWLTRKPRK